MSNENLQNMANALRALAMDAVQKANSGHPGMPMGFADVATVLWSEFLKYDASAPDWPDRDRFVLSAGHGSMLLYGLLHLSGYEDMDMQEITNFRQLNSKCAGHPEYGHAAGIETTTGPLGQGFANAVGMALGERILNAEFGENLVNHKTYAVVGDGCLMEGISQEALTLAGHLRLNNLIVLFDDNAISIDGDTNLADSTDQIARFTASGWDCLTCDGHDFESIRTALNKAQKADKPTFIACKTTIGYGSPNKSNSAAAHGSPLGDDEITATKAALGWDAPPFQIPAPILKAWRTAGSRHQKTHQTWKANLQNNPQKTKFTNRLKGDIEQTALANLKAYKQKITTEKPNQASRVASQKTLENLTESIPAMIAGSADLTGSNNTKTPSTQAITPNDYNQRYIHYGVRELGMAAIMNGLALHQGNIPYGGTFLIFSDYARSAIRLSALMGVRVIYVMTHDSIGLGEDGPTHQPVEQLATLRALPNLLVFRPADALETAEAWEIALQHKNTPSLLALSRQNLPFLRTSAEQNLSAKGGYILQNNDDKTHNNKTRDVTLIATGSEVCLAFDAQTQLAKQGISACVVSMPCLELFMQQSQTYRDEVLGSAPRIIIEAAVSQSWDKFLRDGKDIFIGMHGFGASAPANVLYQHFGITTDNIVAEALKIIKS